MTCDICGNVLRPGAGFCGGCGSPVVASAAAPEGVSPVSPAATLRLPGLPGIPRRVVVMAAIAVVAVLVVGAAGVAIGAAISAQSGPSATGTVESATSGDTDAAGSPGATPDTAEEAPPAAPAAPPFGTGFTALNPASFAPTDQRGVNFVSPSRNLHAELSRTPAKRAHSASGDARSKRSTGSSPPVRPATTATKPRPRADGASLLLGTNGRILATTAAPFSTPNSISTSSKSPCSPMDSRSPISASPACRARTASSARLRNRTRFPDFTE